MEDRHKPIQTFIREASEYIQKIKDVKFVQETYIENEGSFRIVDSAIFRNNEI
jgi:hypothetical protein